MTLPDKNERARLLRYGIGGLSTTLLNIFLFWLLSFVMPGYRSANLIAIILTKLYGFLINKFFVFRSRGLTGKQQAREVAAYVAARGFTGVVDYFGLILLVSGIGLPEMPSKVLIQGLVIVLNYILGKFVVFKPADKAE